MNYFKTAVLMAALMALFGMFGAMLGGLEGMSVMLIIGAVMNFYTYWTSDSRVLRAYSAREVDAASAPEFYGIVQKLAANAGLPMPKVYIIDNPQPNAFATGRNPEHAAVTATTGLLKTLEPREIAGVMAHELAHVKNHDTLTMTIAATIAGAISTIAHFGFWFGGHRSDGQRVNPIVMILMLVAAPLAASILQLAISRSREYAADRMGARIAQDPQGLAAALAKIAYGAQSIPNYTAEDYPATASLFIINPLTGHGTDSLFATHPATENRIAALRQLAGEMTGIRPLIESGRPSTPVVTPDQPPAAPWGPGRKRGPWG
ncbi:MAG: zinc metalloprotease HtpX [Methylobacteriaceae bacterium]|jgi:heat shock protein HtpX|nr:zinc metalloprotease HtpX [Methylobacteriaceae bacterium]